MEKTIEPVNFNASQELIDHVDKIFNDLDRYNDQIVSADIYLKSTNVSEEEDKLVEIKVFLPGHDIFIDEYAGDFVTASQTVYDKVKRILIDQKEKDKENRMPRPDKP